MGRTSLWLAIAADTGATLLVIANALRLLRKVRDLRHCLYSS
jgi:Zn2+/Cd2+-exporting ATPase